MVKAHQVLVHEDEGNLCEKKPVLGQQKFNGQVESVADSLLKLEIISRISKVVYRVIIDQSEDSLSSNFTQWNRQNIDS